MSVSDVLNKVPSGTDHGLLSSRPSSSLLDPTRSRGPARSGSSIAGPQYSVRYSSELGRGCLGGQGSALCLRYVPLYIDTYLPCFPRPPRRLSRWWGGAVTYSAVYRPPSPTHAVRKYPYCIPYRSLLRTGDVREYSPGGWKGGVGGTVTEGDIGANEGGGEGARPILPGRFPPSGRRGSTSGKV